MKLVSLLHRERFARCSQQKKLGGVVHGLETNFAW